MELLATVELLGEGTELTIAWLGSGLGPGLGSGSGSSSGPGFGLGSSSGSGSGLGLRSAWQPVTVVVRSNAPQLKAAEALS